jgi:alkylhydroperoxidase family enzyme
MGVVTPLSKDKAPAEARPVYDELGKAFGRMPNIFAAMAHRPAVLKHFLPLYGAIMREGTVDAKLKELAYLKTSLVNGCEY